MALYARLIVASAAVLFATAVPAYAYDEITGNTPAYSCPTCHGLESQTTSPSVEPTRKGPHGGYTTGTNKCQTCHSVHNAAAGGTALLPEATIRATCETCHDGTGGSGVYGVIERRVEPPPGEELVIGSHDLGDSSIPGGDVDGSSLTVTFDGEGGGLTCTDCHSPHDTETVEPFIGDRLRAAEDTTSGSIATNRLLRKRPGPFGDTPLVETYGTDWCVACHRGSHDTVAGQVQNHPVGDSSDGLDYMNVYRMADYDSTAVDTTRGPLGGSNLGYIVPRTGPPSGALPICQQCHEDSRAIGNVAWQTVSSSESFSPALDGDVAGNPQFQNFPHETVNGSLLVERGSTKGVDTLCLNCHKQSGAPTP